MSLAAALLPVALRPSSFPLDWKPRINNSPMIRRAYSCRSSSTEMERRPELRRDVPDLPAFRESKRVVLVRHGQSTWNEEGRIQGSSDFSVLTPKGEAQAETSRQMLLADQFDVCFTSPLKRSRRTAEIIWNTRKEEMIPEQDLREIDLYSFQGLLKHQGKEKFGNEFRKWQRDAPNFSIDDHYPVRELWDRARNCWSKILSHRGRSVLVVAHNAVNQALVATALGLGKEYFRILLQSNCGVSVLDFIPKHQGGSPHICLNRLNQAPNSPVAPGSSAGRKTKNRIILVCHGATQSNSEVAFSIAGYEPMNMLGIIQSQKTAELLLDLKVNCILCSPRIASVDTAMAISEMQEAADCLGADCVPRYVELKKMLELELEPVIQQAKISVNSNTVQSGFLDEFDDRVSSDIWKKSKKAWNALIHELSDESEAERNVVVVGHPLVNNALLCHCLKLSAEWMSYFHLDAGSVSVIDFPDSPTGRGVIQCINYTSHLGRWSIPVTRSTANDEEF